MEDVRRLVRTQFLLSLSGERLPVSGAHLHGLAALAAANGLFIYLYLLI